MNEHIASIILAQMTMTRLSLNDAVTLRNAAGSALTVMENKGDIRAILPHSTDKIVELMRSDLSALQRRAEEEMEWCASKNVKVLAYGDEDYPERLRHCPDAPLVLFVRGTADLNASRVIDIVGTRKCTPYGQDVIASIVRELHEKSPSTVIVSGLAYGVDIAAHRAALHNGMRTVGVVAHGQDTMYPSLHRKEANEMALGNGGVVTEYLRGTISEPRNFLQRNRIIAGMSDATIIVESAAHGGGLVTARIANEYNREVMAVPGPVNSEFSAGCNNLIRDNKAALITSAQDILNLMGWENETTMEKMRHNGIARDMFLELNDTEKKIADTLKQLGDAIPNAIANTAGMPISVVSSALFAMEMKGVVKSLAGGKFHLVM